MSWPCGVVVSAPGAAGRHTARRDATISSSPTGRGCERRRSATFVGTRSTSPARYCTSAGSRTAPEHPPDPRRRAAGAPPAPAREPVIVSDRERRSRPRSSRAGVVTAMARSLPALMCVFGAVLVGEHVDGGLGGPDGPARVPSIKNRLPRGWTGFCDESLQS
jgi:hypothetical protein